MWFNYPEVNAKKFCKELLRIGVRRIAVADDFDDNLRAAKNFFDFLLVNGEGIEVEFFENGSNLIEAIKDKDSFDLILTDLKMKTDYVGLDIVYKGWSHGIPVVICSGEYQYENQPIVKTSLVGIFIKEGIEKKIPSFWYMILEGIIDVIGDEKRSHPLRQIYQDRCCSESFRQPDHKKGLQMVKIAAYRFSVDIDEGLYNKYEIE